ncbi:MAG: SDR family NAD(P)-dependent oxidoreductase [Alphaproteobacteria bacterium]|nr:SDR family NAD(P)-dependent oxidoreductase [Alphaproteobacteria bacterium]
MDTGALSRLNQVSLQGRVAVVTGGAMGIGSAIARELAGLGAKVLIADRSAGGAEQMAQTLHQAGAQAQGIACDVSDVAQVEQAAQAVCQSWGGIDVLVNCAGVASAPGQPYTRCTPEEWRRTLDINLMGAVHWCAAAREPLLASKAGRIINISSITGVISTPYMPAYSVSKAALISLSKVLARDLAMALVTVNAVCPGYIRTPMWGELVQRGTLPESEGDKFDQRVRLHVPMQRPQSVEDVAACVGFLATDLACHITGQVIGVDGGVTI